MISFHVHMKVHFMLACECRRISSCHFSPVERSDSRKYDCIPWLTSCRLKCLNNHTHALPIPDPRRSDCMLEPTVTPRLHHIGTSFCTRTKILLPHSDRGELAPVRLVLIQSVIFCCYHMNEYRATRGNWSDQLIPE